MKKLFLVLMVAVLYSATGVFAQVGINATGGTPDPSAMLDISSPNRGFVMPRMSTAARDSIVNPIPGLQIYNTDCNNFNYYNGNAWADLNPLAASVSISPNPAGALCAGQSVTFTTTAVNGGAIPAYQWKLNGNNVGSGTDTYITSSLNNADVISCVMTSNAACVSGSPATSNTITVTVNPAPTAGISYSGSPFCTSASPVSVNQTGTTGGVYSAGAGLSIHPSTGEITPSTSTGGSYTVTYTIAAAGGCAQVQATAPITITELPSASISYTGSPYCSNGGSASVSLSGASGGTFSSTAGLDINSGTGEVTLATSTAGTYTVTYSIAAAGGCAQVNATAPITVNAYVSSPQVFSFTGAAQMFIVPCTVTSITIDALGAQGGGSSCGGMGGRAAGDLAVIPGDTLYIYVGGTNGWNGGGQAGAGRAGGGASDVRVGGTALTDRIIVAGGGGGEGGPDVCGGAGGGNTGGTGTSSTGGGGTGGTQTTGGNGGTGCNGWHGTPGVLGQGGGNNGISSRCGGGGGFYGGGGGGYCTASTTGGGGGGSNYIGGVTGTTTNSQGVHTGNGQITISY